MEEKQYLKGKFYTLPILQIIEDNGNAYFQVRANGREYLIRMFEFQRQDPAVRQFKDLPCMVKDIHGDNIVFVQNFARMFGKDYDESTCYPFIVKNHAVTRVDGQNLYNVHDLRGVTFKLRAPEGVFLKPKQKIYCKVRKSDDRLWLEYSPESRSSSSGFIAPNELFKKSGVRPEIAVNMLRLFRRLAIFEESRELLARNDNEWILKALISVPDFWKMKFLKTAETREYVGDYIRLTLFILEESELLQSFPESERENYQESLARKIENAEIYAEVLEMIEADRLRDEIEAILHKIRNAGFIYHPEHKISLLIAVFSIRPDILEERIDAMLDIIADTKWSRRNSEFRKAFCLFMLYYIDTNRDNVNRLALVNDDASNRLLSRMIRSLSYLLLMTDKESIDLPLYRSLLYHYLSYVRYNNAVGVHKRGLELSGTLLERAFQALMYADSGIPELNWNIDFKNTEILAYRMAVDTLSGNTLANRSFESDTVRFSVTNNTITIAPSLSTVSDHNVLPSGVLDWHDIQIYLPNANKYNIVRTSGINKWKEWWRRVEQALFMKEAAPAVRKQRKFIPEVGQEVTIRVLSRESQWRYYCRIEDIAYYGEGYIDVYGKAATVGLFHYDPFFDLDSFRYMGSPLLFKVRVNAIVDNDPENPRFMFDAMSLIDGFIRDNCSHNDETDARIILHDSSKHVMLGISREGYGVFIPDNTPDMEYGVDDSVKVRLTDTSRPNRIQAEVIGLPDKEVNVKDASENLLFSYWSSNGEQLFEESDADLAKDALTFSDDQFEPEHIRQLIAILDHKALLKDRVEAYGYLSVARILARMIGDDDCVDYLTQRQRMLSILEDFGKNGRVDNSEFKLLGDGNSDFIEKYPLLKEKLCQIKIVDSIGRQENNQYLWELTRTYTSGQLIGKLSRLMLSYNISEGMQLQDAYRADILDRIKQLLNIVIAVPKVYSFGEEGQRLEFKTSVIFPPEQNMKPNWNLQTFNILKVIAGMANAFGGTLMLGVYDTGTAKGLDDDLAYFQNNQDKYKLYLRNHIRAAFGGAFNASIVEEFPEAGDKWIYALKIRPVEEPLAMHYGNEVYYFLREGTSTYPYDSVEELQNVMRKRVFADYDMTTDAVVDITEPAEEETPGEAVGKKDSRFKPDAQDDGQMESGITTGRIRPNVVNNWEDGYGADTCGYLRFHDDGTWTRLDDIEWPDGILTLAVAEHERQGSLIIVYGDGEVQRVKMADLLKASLSGRHKMQKGKRPVFISPAKDEDALLVVYRDAKDVRLMRLDDITSMPYTRITESGQAFPDSGISEVQACEIIPAEHHDALEPLHNMQRNYGYRTDHYYGHSQRRLLASLGVKLE